MATMLRDRSGSLSLSATSMRSIMDSIASRLDEARDTGRYLVGLLVFLGLLGTFWGLLDTISSVGATISAIDMRATDSVTVFDELKRGLAAPLRGMGTAFASSLLGLGGSLVLGFLELQASHAHSRFYNQLEEWLSGITELAPGGSQTSDYASRQLYAAIHDMHRAVLDLNERVGAIPRADGARRRPPTRRCASLPRASTSSCARCAPSRRWCASGWTSRPPSSRRWRPCSRSSRPACRGRARAWRSRAHADRAAATSCSGRAMWTCCPRCCWW